MKNLNNISNFKTKFSYEIDKTIEDLTQKGVGIFFVTINYFDEDITKKKIEEVKNDWQKNIQPALKNIQRDNLNWIFSHFILEVSENNLLHSHGILGFKNITGYSKNIELNLKIALRLFETSDIKIEFLEKFINIKRVFVYLYKDYDKDYFTGFINFNTNHQQIFSSFLDFIELDNIIKISGFTVFVHDTEYIFNNPQKKIIFDRLQLIDGLMNIIYSNEKENALNITINMYIYFLVLNNIKQYNDFFIKKVPDLEISYKIFINKNNLIEIWDEVFNFFFDFFPNQIKGLNLYEIKKMTLIWSNLSIKLETLNNLIGFKIQIVFTLIEFTDGIYDLKTGLFYKNKNKKKWSHGTLKYFKQTFKHLKFPSIWLENVCMKLNWDWNNINELFFHLAIIFSTNYEQIKKKRVLFIMGESNTLKTTLIADLFIDYFGMENVALITQSKNFPFQNFESKLIAILDEFKYYDALHNEYLKLFENRNLLVEKKFQNAIAINPLHIVIISNENFIEQQKNSDKQKALDNRVKTFVFSATNDLKEKSIKESIQKENILIVVFLIKYYFEFIKQKKDYRKSKLKKYLTTINFHKPKQLEIHDKKEQTTNTQDRLN